MGDMEWREAERRWRAQPTDQHLTAAIEEGRRQGVAIPGTMLMAQRFPKRTFNCDIAGTVSARLDGGAKRIGETPSKTPLKIPQHRVWWFSPTPRAILEAGMDVVLRVAQRESVLGLVLSLPGVSAADLGRIAVHAPVVIALELHVTGPVARLDESVTAISSLPRLRRLDLRYHSAPPPSLATLRPAPELVDVSLMGHALDASAPEDLPNRLRRLALAGGVHGVMAVDACLARLGQLDELTELELVRTDASDQGLALLLERAGPRLERLRLEGSRAVHGEALAALDAPRLLDLDLGSTLVDGRALARLARVPALRRLGLARCTDLTDADLDHVARLGTLRELDLDHCPRVTSAGLERLTALTGLEKVYLRGNSATVAAQAAGRERLRAALPGCKVV